MAGTLAKINPYSSVPKPDGFRMNQGNASSRNMDEVEFLKQLSDSNNGNRRAEIIDQLRGMVRKNGGKLPFVDHLAVYRGFAIALGDTDWEVRNQCIQLINELIPHLDFEIDQCMAIILSRLIPNMGDSKITIRRSVIQTLHVYMKHTYDIKTILRAIVQHGLENQQPHIKKEAIIALPMLFTPEFAGEDFCEITASLANKLLDIYADKSIQQHALLSMEKIQNLVGDDVFSGYIQKLSPPLRKNYFKLVGKDQPFSMSGGQNITQTNTVANFSPGDSVAFAAFDNYPGAPNGHDTQVHVPSSNSKFEFGVIPSHIMAKLRDSGNFRVRAQAVEELKLVLKEMDQFSVRAMAPHVQGFIAFLKTLLDDSNFKITTVTLEIMGYLIERQGASIKPHLKMLSAIMTKPMSDTKVVIRQAIMKVIMQLMHIFSPKDILGIMCENLSHRNSRVRQETLNIVIASLLTFPSYDFDLSELCQKVAHTLVDPKRQVRQAALECFAVIASNLGAGKLQPLVAAVDAVELSNDGDGVMGAVQARLARRLLPKLGIEGLVEYATPVPTSAGIRGGSVNLPPGADIEWILSASGGLGSSARSNRSDLELESVGSSAASSARSTPAPPYSENYGPTPRRYMSAGKGKNRLPWDESEHGENQENGQHATSPNKMVQRQKQLANSSPSSRDQSPDTGNSYRQMYLKNRDKRGPAQTEAVAQPFSMYNPSKDEEGHSAYSTPRNTLDYSHEPSTKPGKRILEPIADNENEGGSPSQYTPPSKPALARGTSSRSSSKRKVPPIALGGGKVRGGAPSQEELDSARDSIADGIIDDEGDDEPLFASRGSVPYSRDNPMHNSIRQIRHSATRKKVDKIFEKLDTNLSKAQRKKSPAQRSPSPETTYADSGFSSNMSTLRSDFDQVDSVKASPGYSMAANKKALLKSLGISNLPYLPQDKARRERFNPTAYNAVEMEKRYSPASQIPLCTSKPPSRSPASAQSLFNDKEQALPGIRQRNAYLVNERACSTPPPHPNKFTTAAFGAGIRMEASEVMPANDEIIPDPSYFRTAPAEKPTFSSYNSKRKQASPEVDVRNFRRQQLQRMNSPVDIKPEIKAKLEPILETAPTITSNASLPRPTFQSRIPVRVKPMSEEDAKTKEIRNVFNSLLYASQNTLPEKSNVALNSDKSEAENLAAMMQDKRYIAELQTVIDKFKGRVPEPPKGKRPDTFRRCVKTPEVPVAQPPPVRPPQTVRPPTTVMPPPTVRPPPTVKPPVAKKGRKYNPLASCEVREETITKVINGVEVKYKVKKRVIAPLPSPTPEFDPPQMNIRKPLPPVGKMHSDATFDYGEEQCSSNVPTYDHQMSHRQVMHSDDKYMGKGNNWQPRPPGTRRKVPDERQVLEKKHAKKRKRLDKILYNAPKYLTHGEKADGQAGSYHDEADYEDDAIYQGGDSPRRNSRYVFEGTNWKEPHHMKPRKKTESDIRLEKVLRANSKYTCNGLSKETLNKLRPNASNAGSYGNEYEGHYPRKVPKEKSEKEKKLEKVLYANSKYTYNGLSKKVLEKLRPYASYDGGHGSEYDEQGHYPREAPRTKMPKEKTEKEKRLEKIMYANSKFTTFGVSKKALRAMRQHGFDEDASFSADDQDSCNEYSDPNDLPATNTNYDYFDTGPGELPFPPPKKAKTAKEKRLEKILYANSKFTAGGVSKTALKPWRPPVSDDESQEMPVDNSTEVNRSFNNKNSDGVVPADDASASTKAVTSVPGYGQKLEAVSEEIDSTQSHHCVSVQPQQDTLSFIKSRMSRLKSYIAGDGNGAKSKKALKEKVESVPEEAKECDVPREAGGFTGPSGQEDPTKNPELKLALTRTPDLPQAGDAEYSFRATDENPFASWPSLAPDKGLRSELDSQKKTENPFEAKPRLARKPSVHKPENNGSSNKSVSGPVGTRHSSSSSSLTGTPNTFDYSPHGGVTFKENPNLNLQMVGTGYGEDSHPVDPKPSQHASKAKDRRRVSKGSSFGGLGGSGSQTSFDPDDPEESPSIIGKGILDNSAVRASDAGQPGAAGRGLVGVYGVRVRTNSENEPNEEEDDQIAISQATRAAMQLKVKARKEEAERAREERERMICQRREEAQQEREKLRQLQERDRLRIQTEAEERQKNAMEEEHARQKDRLRQLAPNSEQDDLSGLAVSGSSSQPNASRPRPPPGNKPGVDTPSVKRKTRPATDNGDKSSHEPEARDMLPPYRDTTGVLDEVMKAIPDKNVEWDRKCQALNSVRRLALHHSDLLVPNMHALVLAVVEEVKNLRSQVSRLGIITIGELLYAYKKPIEPDLDVITKVLLHKAGEANEFIREDVTRAINNMVENSHPQRAMLAIIAGCADHRNPTVRSTAANFLVPLVYKMGPARLLSGIKDVTDRILPTAANFLLDGNPETRYCGMQIFHLLMSHGEFEDCLKKHLSPNLKRNIQEKLDSLKKKGLSEPPPESSSARKGRSGMVRSGNNSRYNSAHSSGTDSTPNSSKRRSGVVRTDESTMEEIKEFCAKMGAGDWRQRAEGIDELMDMMRRSPDVVGANITKIFDKFVPCLKDANSKVNLVSLRAMIDMCVPLREYMSNVITYTIATIATNLSSKNKEIYESAAEALDCIMENIDHSIILQPFCQQASSANTRIKPDMTERVSYIASELLDTKPKTVVMHALPVLWGLLEKATPGRAGAEEGTVRYATIRMVQTLYHKMGNELLTHAQNTSTVTPRSLQILDDMLTIQL